MLPFVWAFRRMESKPTRPKFAASPKSPPNRSTVSSAVNVLALSTAIGVPMAAALATPADASMASDANAATAAVPLMLSEIMFLLFRVVLSSPGGGKPSGEWHAS